VAWESLNSDGLGGYGVVARRFASSGASVGGELQVNAFTAGTQRAPALGVDSDGDFVVAWQSDPGDASYTGIFAQRFSPIGTLDVDANGSVQALTDGLLFLRFAFTLTGPALTNGAVGAGCTRCDAPSIAAYLAGLGLALDVDGTGTVQPLTDGLLVLRFLFGLTDGPLTSSAVGAGCGRCDATTILPYLQSL
jgi:hypothetical protein